MSQDNVDTFRRAVEAYNSRDVEALVADAHPDIECVPQSSSSSAARTPSIAGTRERGS
jgi:hypothetical protein